MRVFEDQCYCAQTGVKWKLLLRGSKFLAGGYSVGPVDDYYQVHLLRIVRSKYNSVHARFGSSN